MGNAEPKNETLMARPPQSTEALARWAVARTCGLEDSSIEVHLVYPSAITSFSEVMVFPRRDPRGTLVLKPRSADRTRSVIILPPSESTTPAAAKLRDLLPTPYGPLVARSGPADSLCRLREALSSDACDGVVVPKWIVEEVLQADFPDRRLSTAVARATRVILPLSEFAPLPGEGAFISPTRRNASLARPNCPATMQRCREELLAAEGGYRTTILGKSFGEVVWSEEGPSGVRRLSLRAQQARLPKAASRAAVWPPQTGVEDPMRRLPVPFCTDALKPGVGFVVSKSEALPQGLRLPEGAIVIVPGGTTWERLVARGVLVSGSFDGLGEDELDEIAAAFPEVGGWVKLGHSQGAERGDTDLIATYRLETTQPAPRLSGYSHFFWRSGSQFEYYLSTNPELRVAFHGSGPGHTAATIRRHVTDPSHCGVFASLDDFIAEAL